MARTMGWVRAFRARGRFRVIIAVRPAVSNRTVSSSAFTPASMERRRAWERSSDELRRADGLPCVRSPTLSRPGPAAAPPAGFSRIPAELAALGDVVVTKRHRGAFTGTELDLQLRRRGVHRIVLAGISTSVGVESTARTAWENSYQVVFAEDATADTDPASHEHGFGKIFPRIGRVVSTGEILAALRG
ncbi:isochorismatase family protein [Streptomyces sp. NPDC091268]|uniref:isochorismatase family protein n=1 Tax=Streptomyces sp. NPDC091268 TaxID=3365979 RepID=UPI0037FB7576